MQTKLIATVIGAALALPLMAHAQMASPTTYYAGIDAGRSEQKFGEDGVGSLKEHHTSYQVYGGANLTQNFGLEVGYASFGKTTYSDGISRLKISPQSFYLAGTATLPLPQHFALFAKAGVGYSQTKLSYATTGLDGDDTVHKSSAMFGVGASYTLPNQVSVVAEYEDFGTLANGDGLSVKANTFSVGLRYQF